MKRGRGGEESERGTVQDAMEGRGLRPGTGLEREAEREGNAVRVLWVCLSSSTAALTNSPLVLMQSVSHSLLSSRFCSLFVQGKVE
mmetsp:Transcript_53007/g.103697  ORF Transcript_53007/g.103697 Transcript_53007/m.103697 type:complete len:86 (+) Transcript_53007:1470-1727(+)